MYTYIHNFMWVKTFSAIFPVTLFPTFAKAKHANTCIKHGQDTCNGLRESLFALAITCVHMSDYYIN